MSTPYSLLTDRYELTMAECALADGSANRRAVFEVFTRSLPAGRAYGVVAGTSRALDAICNFRFDDDELRWLEDNNIVGRDTLQYLADFSFSGDVYGYLEGDLHFANSPILTIEAPLAEALLLETVVLSILNHDSAIASAAARMVDAAGGRQILEGGSRRTHEQAGVAAARAAYVAGATSTSNLEAGRSYGIPTVGTIGHAYVLSHSDEMSAFRAQHQLLGSESTYLVDTYDISQGIANALEVAGPSLGAIRIDSGDLGAEAKHARDVLDLAGARNTKIVVSGDLDEWSIAALQPAPIDAYMVGTQLVTGSGHPTASMIYKLVAIEDNSGEMLPTAKSSPQKPTVGGRKAAFRTYDADNTVDGETLIIDLTRHIGEIPGPGRGLQVPMIRDGHLVGQPNLPASRAWSLTARAELPVAARLPDSTVSFDTTMLCNQPNWAPPPKKRATPSA